MGGRYSLGIAANNRVTNCSLYLIERGRNLGPQVAMRRFIVKARAKGLTPTAHSR
jgi:hypothetical protein